MIIRMILSGDYFSAFNIIASFYSSMIRIIFQFNHIAYQILI